ncbi:MAG: hypothetical protein ACK5N0_03275, partial [Synechococcaceae cyanobacterium]
LCAHIWSPRERPSPQFINRISVRVTANRSISISLEDGLLAQLDVQGSKRSALMGEALTEWLRRRDAQHRLCPSGPETAALASASQSKWR